MTDGWCPPRSKVFARNVRSRNELHITAGAQASARVQGVPDNASPSTRGARSYAWHGCRYERIHMRTAKALSFSTALCISLLTACGTNTVDDVDITPDGSTMPEPTKEDPAKPTTNNYERWMKCMKLDDFRTAGMVNAWNETYSFQNTTGDDPEDPTDGTPCVTCHENGAEGFIVTPNEQKFFDTIRKNRYYALEYFTFAPLVTPFVVAENKIAMTGVSTGQDPHREHPRFNPNAGLAASREFAMLTQLRYNAASGDCAPE
jgi:hypothetical protein